MKRTGPDVLLILLGFGYPLKSERSDFNGQKVVTNAIRDAVEYALSKEAVLYRKGDPRTHRLAQAADLICTVELATIKYTSGKETATDVKFFGSQANFRRNILKPVRRKKV